MNIPIGLATVILSRRTWSRAARPAAGASRTCPARAPARGVDRAARARARQGQRVGLDAAPRCSRVRRVASRSAVFVRRCRWHAAPMIDLGAPADPLVRGRNVLTLIGAAGFYAYVLCNVLFLTSVWRLLGPRGGPRDHAGAVHRGRRWRGPARQLADRVGARWVLCGGGLIWAAGVARLIHGVGLDARLPTSGFPRW